MKIDMSLITWMSRMLFLWQYCNILVRVRALRLLIFWQWSSDHACRSTITGISFFLNRDTFTLLSHLGLKGWYYKTEIG
jgi:hypothetical protein